MNAPRRWWLPSISVSLWLALFLALNLSPQRAAMISADGDPCWHRRQGDWMIDHRAILRTDQFSHTRAGAQLVEMWWLSELIFAAAGKLLGWGGIVLVAATLSATTIWLLHRQLLAEGIELLLATLLTLLAAAVCATHWLARPHLATMLLFLVFAWQLRGFQLGRISARRLMWLLPLLMMLWVNLHGGFVTGLALVGLHLAGTAVAAFRDRTQADRLPTLVVVLALCLLASLVNPNGWALHAHILAYLRDPFLAGFAQECASPNFHQSGTWPLQLLILATLLLLLIARPRLSAADGLLLVAWFFFSLRMVRNAPLLALAATPILAAHWNEFLQSARESRVVKAWRQLSNRATERDARAGGAFYVALAFVAVVFAIEKSLLPTEIPRNKYPVAAVEFIRQQPAALPGQMFNDMNWGGYLMWALPEQKIFIHANLDLYGPALLREYDAVDDARRGWADVLRKYNVGWTILPARHPLNNVLAPQPGWKVAYTDEVTAIYSRLP